MMLTCNEYRRMRHFGVCHGCGYAYDDNGNCRCNGGKTMITEEQLGTFKPGTRVEIMDHPLTRQRECIGLVLSVKRVDIRQGYVVGSDAYDNEYYLHPESLEVVR